MIGDKRTCRANAGFNLRKICNFRHPLWLQIPMVIIMKKLVFFDLDGTIIPASSERNFFIWLVLHGFIKFKQIFGFAKFVIKWVYHYKQEVFLKNKAYLLGLSVSEVDKLAREFAVNKLLPTIRPKIKKIIDEHLCQNDRVILLSATLEPIAETFAKYLNIPEVVATKPFHNNNIFGSQPPIEHPYSRDKLLVAKRVCDQDNINIKDCVAYGNSIHDLHLLECVGAPIAVTPDKCLRRIALTKKWTIID